MCQYEMKLVMFLIPLAFGMGAPHKKSLVPTLDGRIVGGKDAEIADYPYQVGLLYAYSQYCGGALISSKWVVTAAHCVFGRTIRVRVGSSSANDGGQILETSQKIQHPNYDYWSGLDYDIALIELSTEASGNNISAVALPPINSTDTIHEGSILTVTGWGDIDEEEHAPDTLQVVEVPIINQADCQSAYADIKNGNVTDRMFCAGLLNVGGKDACSGDSGSPATIDGVLSGIVSWGQGCAEAQYPGVYTNVLTLRSWINEITGL